MKRLAVTVLVVVLGVVLLCLGATQKLVNQTGAPASGVTLTFSEAVRITRYDKSVFPGQSPASGESESFSFSGGTLPAGESFQVTWLPSNVKLMSTKWITSGSGKVAAALASAIPASYEEILAQIAHYPGPDEPVYVPAEGEQIWLTDLEGHADIYDNDSIKINYAPWFDKSQISRIDVYRNGVKMRFLPDKVDVLTNEQMKTFDGNPLERTPKSYHTDHAIFGYQYGFWLYAWSSGTPHKTLSAEIKSPIQVDLQEVWASLDAGWTHSLQWLGDGDLDAFFTRLKQDGFTGIMLDLSTFVDSPTANNVWTLDHEDPTLSPYSSIRTASKSEFDRVLSAISKAGLATHVRSTILISLKYPRDQFIFSAYIVPNDLTQFLRSYLALWQEYMPLFERHHVALVTPFIEMDGIINQTEEIRWFYDQLVAGFSGRLGCETTTGDYLRGWSPLQRGRSFAQMAPVFWDWRDPQGRPLVNELDVWQPPLWPEKDQRYSKMIVPFVQFLAPAVDFYRTKYPENPLMYGEIGACDIDGICIGTAVNGIKPRIFDEQETADIWSAYMVGVELQGIRSLTVYLVPLGNLARNDQPGWFFVNFDSGTYRVITSMIGTATTP